MVMLVTMLPVATTPPPKPRYDPNDFITEFCSTVETIITNDASPVIVVTGDFNSLSTGFLEQDYGLTQLVCTATHGNKVLDKIFTNRPDLFTAVVCKSLVKTKHSAVIVGPDRCFTMNTGRSCNRTVVSIYDHRTHHIDRLRCAIGFFNWFVVTLEYDITVMYSRFLLELLNLVKVCIPVNRVRLGPRDPPFITPLTKFLLRKRNRLYHKRRVEQANELAIKINSLIVAERSKTLANLENATPNNFGLLLIAPVNTTLAIRLTVILFLVMLTGLTTSLLAYPSHIIVNHVLFRIWTLFMN